MFTNPLAAANVGTPLGIRLHPTQLYEAGAELLILGLLLVTERRGRTFPGRTFWLYMFLYADLALRHRDLPRRSARCRPFLDMSTSQFISLVLGPLSLIMLVWLSRTLPTAPQDARQRRRAAA